MPQNEKIRMKIRPRLILSLILISSLSFIASAQLRYGFNLGGSLATASISNAPDASMVNRTAFRGGLTLEYQLPRCGAAFDLSILYDRRNTRLRTAPEEAPLCFGRNFIDIPLHAKYKFWLPATGNLFAPMLVTGPSLAINLDGKHHNAGLISQHRLQPSWDFGVGFDAANILQLTVGYRLALTNSIHSSSLLPADASLRNSGAYISALILCDF